MQGDDSGIWHAKYACLPDNGRGLTAPVTVKLQMLYEGLSLALEHPANLFFVQQVRGKGYDVPQNTFVIS
jgi:hypothetical protein